MNPTHNVCTDCLRPMQVILKGEKPNRFYVCTDCRAKPQTSPQRVIGEILLDPLLVLKAKYCSLGLQVARRAMFWNYDGNYVPRFMARARDLLLQHMNEGTDNKQQHFRYEFYIDPTNGKWSRAGLNVRGKGAWFNFDTLKRYGVETVVRM